MDFKQKYFKYLHLPPKIFRFKKTAAFWVFCKLRYFSDNLLSFDTNALYFVRPLYLVTKLSVQADFGLQGTPR